MNIPYNKTPTNPTKIWQNTTKPGRNTVSPLTFYSFCRNVFRKHDGDDVMLSVDQSGYPNRIINQSDCNCARFWEASKIRHQVLGSERWVYWMTLYFWLIKMAPQQLPWLVRMCVINHKNVVPKIKTLNTHNSVNFYSNWKIDPSKPNFSAPSLPMLVQAEELTGGKEMTFFDSPLNGVVTFFRPSA